MSNLFCLVLAHSDPSRHIKVLEDDCFLHAGQGSDVCSGVKSIPRDWSQVGIAKRQAELESGSPRKVRDGSFWHILAHSDPLSACQNPRGRWCDT